MLKHEGYKIGDKIKAYDFEPLPDRSDKYVIGTIKEIQDYPFKAYIVKVEEDSIWPDTPRDEVMVPMQVSLMEYNHRITKIQ